MVNTRSSLLVCFLGLCNTNALKVKSGSNNVCDASEKCAGQCWAHVKEKTELKEETEIEFEEIEFEMKVLQNDAYISRGPLCGGNTMEYADVLGLLIILGSAERGTFLDIGANLGSWSLPVAMHKKQFNVVTVDVSSTTTNLLHESVKANNMEDRFQINRLAIIQDSAINKTICMGSTEKDLEVSSNLGMNMVNLGERDFCAEEVPARTLDSMYADTPALQNVIAAKLDCEGCEAQALFGASRLLSENPPCLLALEISPVFLCHASSSGEQFSVVEQLHDFLVQKGYAASPMLDFSTARIPCGEVLKDHVEQHEQKLVFIQQREMQTCLAKFM